MLVTPGPQDSLLTFTEERSRAASALGRIPEGTLRNLPIPTHRSHRLRRLRVFPSVRKRANRLAAGTAQRVCDSLGVGRRFHFPHPPVSRSVAAGTRVQWRSVQDLKRSLPVSCHLCSSPQQWTMACQEHTSRSLPHITLSQCIWPCSGACLPHLFMGAASGSIALSLDCGPHLAVYFRHGQCLVKMTCEWVDAGSPDILHRYRKGGGRIHCKSIKGEPGERCPRQNFIPEHTWHVPTRPPCAGAGKDCAG